MNALLPIEVYTHCLKKSEIWQLYSEMWLNGVSLSQLDSLNPVSCVFASPRGAGLEEAMFCQRDVSKFASFLFD